MATRLYFMPITGTGQAGDSRRPEYADTILSAAAWSAMDFGNEPWMLVATEANPTLAAQPDAFQLPLDLSLNLGTGAVTQAQAFPEAANIPADWVTTSLTFRQVLRAVAAIFQFMQRCQGLGLGRLFTGTVNLSTQFNQLPLAARQLLLNAAQSLQFDSSGLTGTSTLRQILKAMMVQFMGPIQLADVTI